MSSTEIALGTPHRVNAGQLDQNSLAEENRRLKQRIEHLERQLDFLTKHKTLAAGLKGERLISALVNGKKMAYASTFDVLSVNNQAIEVKFSKINTPNKSNSDYKRWNWVKLLGQSGNKKYDFILLVGEKPQEGDKSGYKDDAPFALYLLTPENIRNFAKPTGNAGLGIAMPVTPWKGKLTNREFHKSYHVSASEVRDRFGVDLEISQSVED